jgi:hypothetical protein
MAFRLLQRENQLHEMQEKERSDFIIADYLPQGENQPYKIQEQGPNN